MPKLELIKNTFGGGEIEPGLYSRTDLSLYNKAAKLLYNWFVRPSGGISNRSGTIYQATGKYDSKEIRLIPFEYSTLQNYVIEFGHYYNRFYTNLGSGGQINTSQYQVDEFTGFLMHYEGVNNGIVFTEETGQAVTNRPPATIDNMEYANDGAAQIAYVSNGIITDTVLDLMEYSSDALAQSAYVTNAVATGIVSATGGTITTDGSYKVHTFTSDGTFTPRVQGSASVAVLIVGGGGGGGYGRGGGGGGGGVVYNSSYSVSDNTGYGVTVGGGGPSDTNGSNSVFGSTTAYGGGCGGGEPGYGTHQAGADGGCGGGPAVQYAHGHGSQGYDGGACGPMDNYYGGGGGGGGGVGGDGTTGAGGNGGAGYYSTISGTGLYYAGGGGGSGNGNSPGSGGSGVGGAGVNQNAGTGNAGTNGRGGGGGGGSGGSSRGQGGAGGSGIVIVRYTPFVIALQSYSESSIKSQGSYCLKGVATTSALNKTLTRTIGSPIDLSGKTQIKFDIYSSRTGSNIKIGIHDTGGTTSEITPNITLSNTWQSVTWDISAISDANKNAIDNIIITIVNADANNTFYIDNMRVDTITNLQSYSEGTIKTQGDYSLKGVALMTESLNKTLTHTISVPVDLTGKNNISFDIRSSRTGANIKIGIHDSGGTTSEKTYTVLAANTWETVTWDISGVSDANKNAIDSVIITIVNADAENTFYIDNFYSGTQVITDTSVKEIGTSSGYFDGTNYLTLANSVKQNLYISDFTYEQFIAFEALSSQWICGNGGTTSGGWGIKYDNTAHTLAFWANGSSRATVSFTPNTDTLYHIEIARSSGSIKLAINGAFGGASTYAASITSTYSFTFGKDSQESTLYFNGWQDEARLSVGICRHFSDFTPISSTSVPYEIVTVYAEEDLPYINYTQSADVMYLAHPDYSPKELVRIDNTNWTINDYDFIGGPFMLPNTDNIKTIAASAVSAIHGNIESIADYSGTVTGTVKLKDTAHGLVNNDIITIKGTTSYDGTYTVTKIDNDYVYFTHTFVASETITSTTAWVKNITLTASGFTFQAGHVGSLWQLEHYIEGQTASSAFTEDGSGTAIKCGGTWRLITHGTWTGKLTVERSSDGSTNWTTLRDFTGADDTNVNTYGTEDMSDNAEPFYVRLTWDDTSGTCNADLTTDSFYQKGIAKITAVAVGGATATAIIKRTLGLTDATIDWAEGAWSDYRGWPSTVEFSPQDRLMWANTYTQPQTHWDSKIGVYNDFSRGDPLADNDGITADLPARKVNGIFSIIPLSTVIALTSSSEWGILSSDGSAITPTSILHKPYGYDGAANVRPVIIGNRAIYVQILSEIIRDLGYELYSDSFTGSNISILSNHLFTGYTIKEMAYAQNPDRLVYAVRSDGKLLTLTFMREQEVVAWTWNDTFGGVDLFKSITSIPNATAGYNEVWVVVKRGVKRYIERFAQRLASIDPSEQIFMDSTITYRGTPTNNVTGLDHLNGYEVAILADGNVMERQIVAGGTLPENLPSTYSVIHVGIPYNSDLETLNVEVNMSDGTLQGKKVKISQVAIRVLNSRGGYIGSDVNTLYPISGSPMSSPTVSVYDKTGVLTLCSGEIKKNLGAGYEDGGRIYLRQSSPLPITLTALIPSVKSGGRTAE